MMAARLLLLCVVAEGLLPPTSRVAPATRRRALPDLVSLLLAEGPEIEGASAPVGPIAAAIIAVSGYTFEARKARSEELSRELSRRFKEEEKLYVPINVYFHSLLFSIYSFVGEHSEAKGEAYTSDDRVVSEFAHDWVWNEPDGLFQLSVKSRNKPVATSHELPAELEARIRAEPDSELARKYRAWAREELYTPIRRISDVAYQSVDALEPIPVDRLRELFREPPIGFRDWGFTPRGIFFSMWLAYRRGWDVVLAEWDAGDYSRVRPAAPFPVGLLYYVIECQSIVGKGKKDLLGFSQMDGLRGDAGMGRYDRNYFSRKLLN